MSLIYSIYDLLFTLPAFGPKEDHDDKKDQNKEKKEFQTNGDDNTIIIPSLQEQHINYIALQDQYSTLIQEILEYDDDDDDNRQYRGDRYYR